MLILGGRLIDGHLGKDPQRLCKDYLSVDRGSINSHLGKDLQRLCKDYLSVDQGVH